MSKQLPERASVVVVGGGVIGTSIAFHLAESGVRDVVLVERDELACGSTCKAAGGVRASFSNAANIAIGLRGRDPFHSRELAGDYPSAAAVIGLLLDSIFLDALEGDIERLERVNHLLQLLPPGVAPPEGLRPVNLLVVRPSRDVGAIAAQHASRSSRNFGVG